jgi:hypothetical protein
MPLGTAIAEAEDAHCGERTERYVRWRGRFYRRRLLDGPTSIDRWGRHSCPPFGRHSCLPHRFCNLSSQIGCGTQIFIGWARHIGRDVAGKATVIPLGWPNAGRDGEMVREHNPVRSTDIPVCRETAHPEPRMTDKNVCPPGTAQLCSPPAKMCGTSSTPADIMLE